MVIRLTLLEDGDEVLFNTDHIRVISPSYDMRRREKCTAIGFTMGAGIPVLETLDQIEASIQDAQDDMAAMAAVAKIVAQKEIAAIDEKAAQGPYPRRSKFDSYKV